MFEELADLPGQVKALKAEAKTFTHQLETLNTNLEALALLAERWQGVPEILSDLRQMTAGLLGWRVKDAD